MAEEKTLDGSFLELLLELKRAIMQQLKVASLGLVQSVDTSKKTLTATLFPLAQDEEQKSIQCRYADINPAKGDIVLILFLDRSFMTNLLRMERGDKSILTVKQKIFHTEDYGIAIQIIVKKESGE